MMTNFTVYTPVSAPEKSRGILKTWQERLGFLPNLFGAMSESPVLMKGYTDLWTAYEGGIFSPIERAVINLTIDSLNVSPYSIAMHSTLAEKAGIPADVILALREEKPLKDVRLEGLRLFVGSFMKKMGRVDERDLAPFYGLGFTKAHVMEVILAHSLISIGNYASHVSAPVLDKVFEPNRIDLSKKPVSKPHAA